MATVDVGRWLKGLDSVFLVQKTYLPFLLPLARSMHIRVVLMPNAEWFDPNDPHMNLVDTFIAPTRACEAMLHKCGFGRLATYIPHVVDTNRFAFKRRLFAKRFLHCRGWGGHKERKGTSVIQAVALRCPETSFVVRYQEKPGGQWPQNTVLYGPTETPEEQYELGDVAIQPSRWEGVGLQILEAMSCGIPTLVPDAPPMNEYPADPFFCVPCVAESEIVGRKSWTAWEIDVDALSSRVTSIQDHSVEEFSCRARSRIEERSWDVLRGSYAKVLAESS